MNSLNVWTGLFLAHGRRIMDEGFRWMELYQEIILKIQIPKRPHDFSRRRRVLMRARY